MVPDVRGFKGDDLKHMGYAKKILVNLGINYKS